MNIMSYLKWFATTVTGLEDLAAREAEELAGVAAEPDVGKIFFSGLVEHAAKINFASTMVNRVFLLLSRTEVSSLEDIYRHVKSLDYAWLMDPHQTFAVRAERHCKQLPFTSVDASAAVGRGIIDSLRESSGRRPRVDLDRPDVEFYCLLRDSEMILGVNVTGESLHRRYYRVYHHRAGLQATIASAMLKIAGWGERDSLLDPMCGSGTIPIEAAISLRRIPPGLMRGGLRLMELKFVEKSLLESVAEEVRGSVKPEKSQEIAGSDVSQKSIEGAELNARAAGVADTVRLRVADVFRMPEWLDAEPSHIVTNPPYGLRMGVRDITSFYRKFVRSVRESAPGSRLTVIVSKPTLFSRILGDEGYSVISSREVMYGRLRAYIISAER